MYRPQTTTSLGAMCLATCLSACASSDAPPPLRPTIPPHGLDSVAQPTIPASGPASLPPGTETLRDGLCLADLPGTRVDVDDEGSAIVVRFLTDDPAEALILRARARKMATTGRYRPASPAGDQQGMPVNARVIDIDRGVMVLMSPTDPMQSDILEAQAENDLELLTSGRCTSYDLGRS